MTKKAFYKGTGHPWIFEHARVIPYLEFDVSGSKRRAHCRICVSSQPRNGQYLGPLWLFRDPLSVNLLKSTDHHDA